MDAFELDIHRTNTTAFIAARPTSLVLTPVSARTRIAGGQWSNTDGDPREPQIVRLIEPSSITSPRTIKTQNGQERDIEFVILAPFDAPIASGDHWSDSTGEWEIHEMMTPENGYERRGVVVRRGAAQPAPTPAV